MNKCNLRLIGAMSVVLFSAPALGQVVTGGAAGSIGGNVNGTLQGPSVIDRMHSERARIEHTSVSAAGKARRSAEVTTKHTRDRAAESKENISDRTSTVAAKASATASGAVSATQATTQNASQSVAHAAGSAAVAADALITADKLNGSGAPVETSPPSEVGGERDTDDVGVNGAGAGNLLAGASAQTQPSSEATERTPSKLAVNSDLSGGGDAHVAADSARAGSSAQSRAAARRNGGTIAADASASGEANALVNHTN